MSPKGGISIIKKPSKRKEPKTPSPEFKIFNRCKRDPSRVGAGIHDIQVVEMFAYDLAD